MQRKTLQDLVKLWPDFAEELKLEPVQGELTTTQAGAQTMCREPVEISWRVGAQAPVCQDSSTRNSSPLHGVSIHTTLGSARISIAGSSCIPIQAMECDFSGAPNLVTESLMDKLATESPPCVEGGLLAALPIGTHGGQCSASSEQDNSRRDEWTIADHCTDGPSKICATPPGDHSAMQLVQQGDLGVDVSASHSPHSLAPLQHPAVSQNVGSIPCDQNFRSSSAARLDKFLGDSPVLGNNQSG